jgi:hypothetical protein
MAVLGGCAAPKQMAKGATEGALEEVKEQSQQRPDGGPPATEELARNIVKGTAFQLDKPETREQFGRIIETATRSAVQGALGEFTNSRGGWGDSGQGFHMGPPSSSPTSTRPAMGPLGPIGPLGMLGGKMAEGFTLGMSRQLQIELGPNGEGPLGQTLTGVMRQATQAAISGATHELAPADCAGLDGRECADRRVRDLSRSAAKGFVDGLGSALQIPLLVGAFLAGVVGALIVFLLMRLRRPVLIASDGGSIRREPQPHGM